MKRMRVLLALLSAIAVSASAQSTTNDIEYARVGDQVLNLDLHTPKVANAPLLVYVHGGAWRGGSKSDVPIAKLLDHGFAIASVDYRLSTQAVFPAQIHDIKAAIRFLRAKSKLFQINTASIGIVGSSAGGHLAALVGVTNGHAELEGTVGEHLDQSSDVQCIVSLFGASNRANDPVTEHGVWFEDARACAATLPWWPADGEARSRQARQPRGTSRQE